MGDKAQARAHGQGRPARRSCRAARARSDGVDEAQRAGRRDRLSRSCSRPPPAAAAAACAIVRERRRSRRAFATCQAEAQAAFGSSDLYLEKFVEDARHVEVQVLGDRNGIRVHLGERDCSVQRRHQKLLEESPAPPSPPETRAGLYKAALAVANAVNYVSRGHRGVPRRRATAASTSSR